MRFKQNPDSKFFIIIPASLMIGKVCCYVGKYYILDHYFVVWEHSLRDKWYSPLTEGPQVSHTSYVTYYPLKNKFPSPF